MELKKFKLSLLFLIFGIAQVCQSQLKCYVCENCPVVTKDTPVFECNEDFFNSGGSTSPVTQTTTEIIPTEPPTTEDDITITTEGETTTTEEYGMDTTNNMTTDVSTTNGSTTDSSTTNTSTTNGSTTNGSTTNGSTTNGSTTNGSITDTSTTDDSTTDGLTTDASTTDGSTTYGQSTSDTTATDTTTMNTTGGVATTDSTSTSTETTTNPSSSSTPETTPKYTGHPTPPTIGPPQTTAALPTPPTPDFINGNQSAFNGTNYTHEELLATNNDDDFGIERKNNQTYVNSSVIRHPRQRRAASAGVTYHCYRVEAVSNGTLSTNRGCSRVTTEESVCGHYQNQHPNVTVNKCFPCSNNQCNASSIFKISFTAFVISLIAFIMQTH